MTESASSPMIASVSMLTFGWPVKLSDSTKLHAVLMGNSSRT